MENWTAVVEEEGKAAGTGGDPVATFVVAFTAFVDEDYGGVEALLRRTTGPSGQPTVARATLYNWRKANPLPKPSSLKLLLDALGVQSPELLRLLAEARSAARGAGAPGEEQQTSGGAAAGGGRQSGPAAAGAAGTEEEPRVRGVAPSAGSASAADPDPAADVDAAEGTKRAPGAGDGGGRPAAADPAVFEDDPSKGMSQPGTTGEAVPDGPAVRAVVPAGGGGTRGEGAGAGTSGGPAGQDLPVAPGRSRSRRRAYAGVAGAVIAVVLVAGSVYGYRHLGGDQEAGRPGASGRDDRPAAGAVASISATASDSAVSPAAPPSTGASGTAVPTTGATAGASDPGGVVGGSGSSGRAPGSAGGAPGTGGSTTGASGGGNGGAGTGGQQPGGDASTPASTTVRFSAVHGYGCDAEWFSPDPIFKPTTGGLGTDGCHGGAVAAQVSPEAGHADGGAVWQFNTQHPGSGTCTIDVYIPNTTQAGGLAAYALDPRQNTYPHLYLPAPVNQAANRGRWVSLGDWTIPSDGWFSVTVFNKPANTGDTYSVAASAARATCRW
ncbi:hypothetical protein [Kitasatospora griseola]|uniref:hypothetical protein n=1 Tax=Kitasatospora griseola TaxID=2064 RepID=UPI00166FDDF9|nr:hypothetical protein [Kitasatospora griseola]GGR00636.1 hypothetical protein GCM10010195_65550 [Kitasatospora griseola]